MECHLSKSKNEVRGTGPQQEETVSTDLEGDKSETTSTDTSNSDGNPENADCSRKKSSGSAEGTQRNRMPSVIMTPPEETTSPPSGAQFHIPSSNMSETGQSESSLASEHLVYYRSALTKTESLSARQQVALWLTKTSMTNLSSMPSIRSLVPVQSSTPNGEKSPKVNRKRIIQRNHSAKSLMSSLSFGFGKSEKGRSDDPEATEAKTMMHSPIRKCETVLALSGTRTPSCCPSRAPTPSTVIASGSCSGSYVYPCCSGASHKSASSNLYARLYHDNPTTIRKQVAGHTHSTPVGGITPHARSVVSEAPFSGSGCDSPFPGLRPHNRLRYTSSLMCSGCSFVISTNVSRVTSRMTSRAQSQMSLANCGARRKSGGIGTLSEEKETEFVCKICLFEYPPREMAKLQTCGCFFCKECTTQYITFEVMAGSYDISCPDPDCEQQGIIQFNEVDLFAGKDVLEKHKKFRLNTEVALDKERAWCPQAGCETICHICTASNGPADVKCPSCQKVFCSLCSAGWHPGLSCEENGKALVHRAGTSTSLSGMIANAGGDVTYLIDGIEIKRCPMCFVPIERDAGCAQMMCKRCKHAFCWYCLESLDGDFLLRHYDRGACKGQLGHSRFAVLWHRVQVVAMCAALGLVVLVASPFILAVAPCIVCCGYRSWGKGGNSPEEDGTIKPKQSQSQLNITHE